MKLKKIASLVLAGVMAVSMLTACGDNISEQPPVDNGNDTTPATGYSATFEGRLSDRGDANISMSDNDALNNALKAAMDFASDSHIAFDYGINYNHKVNFVEGKANGTDLNQVAAELIKAADTDKESMEKDVAEIFNVLNPNDNKDDYKKDNLDVVMLYVVDGGLSTDAAVMEVADELNKEMEDLVRSYNTKGTNNSTVENVYTYTGSVSADTITLDADHGKSMTFVAVEIVRKLA